MFQLRPTATRLLSIHRIEIKQWMAYYILYILGRIIDRDKIQWLSVVILNRSEDVGKEEEKEDKLTDKALFYCRHKSWK